MPKRKNYFTAAEAARLELDERELEDCNAAIDLFVEFGGLVNPGGVSANWVEFAKKVIAFAKDVR